MKILTTTSEFHSFSRQISRLEELPEVEVTRVETSCLGRKTSTQTNDDAKESFLKKIIEQLQSHSFDLFFISQVFFDSGYALTINDLERLSRTCPPSTMMVVDGYHGFCAVPTDFSKLESKIFYLSGGYKYAQAGEGACFLVVPKGEWRPAYTGWFAEFGTLSAPKDSRVQYAPHGFSFFGATQDFSGLYRFNAVWDQFDQLSITPSEIHLHVRKLQELFLEEISPYLETYYDLTPLLSYSTMDHFGHFLTYVPRQGKADEIEHRLRNNNIYIDRRGERIRFGFGLYHDQEDVLGLKSHLKN